jgi:hypothetical protein
VPAGLYWLIESSVPNCHPGEYKNASIPGKFAD